MKKILLILVGGTICTALDKNNTLSISDTAGVMLKTNFLASASPFAKEVEIELSENLFILSENMTVDAWNKIIAVYRKEALKGYDGIIFAHGTDTLAFSASLFSMLLSNTKIPVFFVSSNARLTSSKANGNENFRCAVECICRGITPNVYVSYKNISDKRMYLHLASRIRQCENYSDDFFSVGAMDLTDITEQNYKAYFEKIEKLYPKDKRRSIVGKLDDIVLKNCVLMIEPYVGLRYDVFDYSLVSAILHGSYHSGTACTQNGVYSILSMLQFATKQNPSVDVYISPSKSEGEVYETVPTMANHTANGKNINFLFGTTKETAYAKLLIAYSLFENKKDIQNFLSTEINFENIA